jgi:hypothetical protein
VLQINPIAVFQQFGYVELKKTSDGHSVGRCPFCGKEDHFSIRYVAQNRPWDCKHCSRSGGYKKFLEQVVEVGKSHFKDKAVVLLSESRNIGAHTFQKLDVGYLPFSDKFVVPAYSFNGKDINNIKIYDGESFKNTTGCHASMYGLWLLPKDIESYSKVYITEGEWDTMVLMEIFNTLKIKDSIVIGVPGAGTFKSDIIPYLTGKDVYLLYDNDIAGENGCKRVISIINSVTGKIYGLKWPDTAKPGEDVRDLYKKNKSDAQKTIIIFINCAK